jgi:Asp-tRNA(Asn)/Glu-tRNA(Gln) amidotransferase C subunit
VSEEDRGELTASLARAAGLSLPEDRVAEVGEALAALLALAATLEELSLDGVEPALGCPRRQ